MIRLLTLACYLYAYYLGRRHGFQAARVQSVAHYWHISPGRIRKVLRQIEADQRAMRR